MPMFVKKPVVVEARQLIGDAGETMQVAEWVAANGYPWLLGDATKPWTLAPEGYDSEEEYEGPGIWIDPHTGELVIRTLEGDMRASYRDWIIQGVHDEFYPCKPAIFQATYDPVGEKHEPVEPAVIDAMIDRKYAEVFRDPKGLWRWRVVGGNHQKMAQSQPYVTKWGAKRAVNRLHPGIEIRDGK